MMHILDGAWVVYVVFPLSPPVLPQVPSLTLSDFLSSGVSYSHIHSFSSSPHPIHPPRQWRSAFCISSVNSSADGGRMVDIHVYLVSSMLGFCLTHAGLVRAVPITLSSCVHLPYCVWNFPWSYPSPLTMLLLPLLGWPLSLVGTGVICMYHCG